MAEAINLPGKALIVMIALKSQLAQFKTYNEISNVWGWPRFSQGYYPRLHIEIRTSKIAYQGPGEKLSLDRHSG